MTFTQLQILTAVVHTGSFSKAGEVLHMSQPAISHAIANLEDELGVVLLHRNRGGVTLTDIGEKVLLHARKILYHEEQLKHEVSASLGLQTGTVRIGCFPSISSQWFPDIIRSFREKYPRIKLKIAEGTYEEIKEWISANKVHIGFVTLPCSSLDSIPLLSDEFVAVLPPAHALRNKIAVEIESLAKEAFIMPDAGCQTAIKSAFTVLDLLPQTQFEIRETMTILSMVQAGVGVSILPRLSIPNAYLHLTATLVPGIYREIGMASCSFESLSPPAKAFTDYMMAWNRLREEKADTPFPAG